MVGSDWIWELRVPVAANRAVREFYALAATRDLHPQRPDGLINLFDDSAADPRTVRDPGAAFDAIATGGTSGQLWADGGTDIFVSWEEGTLLWALDSAFCHRRPTPEADTFRELHARLRGLWLDAAQRLNADLGRVLDEWSSEQLRHSGRHDAGGDPMELGWWAYLGPSRQLPIPPSPEVLAVTRRLPNGASHISLLEDPAAVDVLRYETLHR